MRKEEKKNQRTMNGKINARKKIETLNRTCCNYWDHNNLQQIRGAQNKWKQKLVIKDKHIYFITLINAWKLTLIEIKRNSSNG
jgi:hypothetical protein